MPTTDFEIIRLTPLIMSAVGQTLFVLFYSVRKFGAGQWWHDPVGRALFIKSFTLTILLDTIVLSFIARWNDGGFSGVTWHLVKYQGNLEYLIVFGYWAVCFGVYYQLIVLLLQRFAAHKKKLSLSFIP